MKLLCFTSYLFADLSRDISVCEKVMLMYTTKNQNGLKEEPLTTFYQNKKVKVGKTMLHRQLSGICWSIWYWGLSMC